MFDLGVWLIFALGIVVGGIVFSLDFRVKFFKGFRKLLKGIANNGKKSSSDIVNPVNVQGGATSSPGQVNIYLGKEHGGVVQGTRQCEMCKGSGKVVEKPANPLMKGSVGFKERIITCPKCKGSGVV